MAGWLQRIVLTIVLCCVLARVNSDEYITVGLYLHVQQVPRAYLPPTWTESTYSQHHSLKFAFWTFNSTPTQR
jgi:hypothetical protein